MSFIMAFSWFVVVIGDDDDDDEYDDEYDPSPHLLPLLPPLPTAMVHLVTPISLACLMYWMLYYPLFSSPRP